MCLTPFSVPSIDGSLARPTSNAPAVVGNWWEAPPVEPIDINEPS